LTRAAVSGIEATGRSIITLAPTASSVDELKKEGFKKSQTFQAFESQLLQSVARGQVLWVDEAGFLSSRQMRFIVDFAKQNGCRLILSGDTKQYHGVERGDALRVLEEAGVVSTATLSKIIRPED
jgi:ATP-dependent exoDNAse (exonuclease V) alpha subunit